MSLCPCQIHLNRPHVQVREAEGLPHSGRWYCFDDVAVDAWDIANLEQDCFGGHAPARPGDFYTSPLQVCILIPGQSALGVHTELLQHPTGVGPQECRLMQQPPAGKSCVWHLRRACPARLLVRSTRFSQSCARNAPPDSSASTTLWWGSAGGMPARISAGLRQAGRYFSILRVTA